MIVYISTKSGFCADVFSNRIEEKVVDLFRQKVGKGISPNEIKSMRNSLPFMDRILNNPDIPDDSGVAIEFNVPNTGKRIDFILTGKRSDGASTAVIVELKQWQDVKSTTKDATVSTFIGGRERETVHPSYQAWSYAMLIEDFNETVREEPIHLKPCAYLHNCEARSVIQSDFYSDYTNRAPAFLKDDADKLRDFIKKHVKFGDRGDAMYRIEQGKISPSKHLADHLSSMLAGNREFYLIDDQKLVYETALELAIHSKTGKKNVLIVNGGPGTGKSVVAINVLVELTRLGLVTQYVTKNSAPREVYAAKLTGSMKKSRISNLFVGSGKFVNAEPNEFGALVVDEAHRLNEKSGMMRNRGENQIKEIINAARFTVFFLDEDQQVHWMDIGDKEEIRRWAEHFGAEVTELDLTSQFRCNGSDGYLAWVDQVLQIRETANTTLEGSNYEFIVCDSAEELRQLVYEKNRINNRARMVAGYCWDWGSKKKRSSNVHDLVLDDEKFKAKWNLSDDGMLWILKPSSVHEAGCIHTCQGLELDYVGVIVGPDLVIREEKVETDAFKRSSGDSTIRGFRGLYKKDPSAAREKAERIIKNTYRTLMTRGIRGCYFYSTDKETNEFFKQFTNRVAGQNLTTKLNNPVLSEIPFEIMTEQEARGVHNAVPLFDLKIAAGNFSDKQWVTETAFVQLPPHINAPHGHFVAQVVGESMNKKIPNGSWCLFKRHVEGSRQGKIVLVQSRLIQDPDTGGHFTVKKYRSEKQLNEDSWTHQKIILDPMSFDNRFQPILLKPSSDADFQVVGEFVAIIS